MRVMMMVIPKGYEKAEPGFMPDAKLVEKMMAYNKSLAEAGVRREGHGDRRAIQGGERADRRLLDDPGQVEGRSDRMGIAGADA